jgi:HEPN domain-containing protein
MKRPIDQAVRFLKLAERDLQAVYVLKEAPQISLTTICFHAQQVVEKSLKSI